MGATGFEPVIPCCKAAGAQRCSKRSTERETAERKSKVMDSLTTPSLLGVGAGWERPSCLGQLVGDIEQIIGIELISGRSVAQ